MLEALIPRMAFDPMMVNFLRLVLEKERFAALPAISREYRSLADVLAKCLYGLLIFKIARIKSMDDDPAFAEQEFKEAPSSK